MFSLFLRKIGRTNSQQMVVFFRRVMVRLSDRLTPGRRRGGGGGG